MVSVTKTVTTLSAYSTVGTVKRNFKPVIQYMTHIVRNTMLTDIAIMAVIMPNVIGMVWTVKMNHLN